MWGGAGRGSWGSIEAGRGDLDCEQIGLDGAHHRCGRAAVAVPVESPRLGAKVGTRLGVPQLGRHLRVPALLGALPRLRQPERRPLEQQVPHHPVAVAVDAPNGGRCAGARVARDARARHGVRRTLRLQRPLPRAILCHRHLARAERPRQGQ